MNRTRTMAVLLAGLMGAGVLASCSKKSSAMAKGAGQRPVPVTVATAERRTVPLEINTFGTVEANASVTVKPQVSGTILKVHFQKGQEVRKDDLLFTIDPRPFQAALDQAQANLARDQVQEANARRDAAREAELLKQKYSAQSTYDKAQSEADALAAAVRADAAVVENAKLQLEYCTIRSPMDGRAGNVLTDAGNLVKTGETALVTIKQIHPVEVFFSLPQRDLPILRKYVAQGKPAVRASIPRQEGASETGELTFIDNAVDKATGTLQLAATFENKSERLWPGLYVNVTLTLAMQENAVLVPSRAVQTGRDEKYVFIIRDDNIAETRKVVVRATAGPDTVIEQGLQAGERVVTDGQVRLLTGSKVEIAALGGKAAGGGKGKAAGASK